MAKYTLKGVILPFNNQSSINDRVYTKESVVEAFDKFKENVSKGEMYGCLETRHFPSVEATGNVPIECISHQVKNAKLSDEGISVDIEVLDTKEGNMVKQLMDHDIPLWGGICGLGQQGEDGIMNLSQIKCVNLTCCPSFNPDEYSPLMPKGSSSDILRKELKDMISHKKLAKKKNK